MCVVFIIKNNESLLFLSSSLFGNEDYKIPDIQSMTNKINELTFLDLLESHCLNQATYHYKDTNWNQQA